MTKLKVKRVSFGFLPNNKYGASLGFKQFTIGLCSESNAYASY